MQIDHDEGKRRFTTHVDGGDAVLTYAPAGDHVLDLLHTMVPPQAEGHGVGDALVHAAMSFAREKGFRIIPTCPYVRSWLKHHPEEQDLVIPQ